LGSASNSAARDKGHTDVLYSKNSGPAAEVGMSLSTTALGLYGGVLWSGELQGFNIRDMGPTDRARGSGPGQPRIADGSRRRRDGVRTTTAPTHRAARHRPPVPRDRCRWRLLATGDRRHRNNAGPPAAGGHSAGPPPPPPHPAQFHHHHHGRTTAPRAAAVPTSGVFRAAVRSPYNQGPGRIRWGLEEAQAQAPG
jgi:hypothetical protein